MKVYHITAESVWPETYFSIASGRASLESVKDVLAGKVENLRYELVAEVDCDDLDDAYRLTNSIDEYWGENEGVTDLTDGCRSTSVGDILETSTGYKYVVANFGFESLHG